MKYLIFTVNYLVGNFFEIVDVYNSNYYIQTILDFCLEYLISLLYPSVRSSVTSITVIFTIVGIYCP